MKAEFEKTYTITLVLEQDEADWLMGLMQNPMYEDESEKDKAMRYTFFNTLKGD